MTSAPEAARSAANAEPIKPDAADTMTRITPSRLLPAELRLERALLKPVLYRDQEPRRVGAVDQPVIISQGQVHDRAHRGDLAKIGILDDHRSLADRSRAKDADLRLIDDWRVEQRPATARVGQRERAASEVIGADLARPGARGQVGYLSGQPSHVQVASVP